MPGRAVSSEPRDDCLLPFAVEALDLRGRLVRLGPTVDKILSHYDYPTPVARVLGEAVTLAALLGSILESHGRFQLQTRGDGAVEMIVVDYDAPGRLRGFVRYDPARVGAAEPASQLLGRGHMALTIEREEDAARYQGVVALEGEGLAEAAHRYFLQSEQIPSFVRLAVAEVVTPRGRSWRAGGLLLQYLPASGLAARDLPSGDAPSGAILGEMPEEADAWAEGLALAATLEDHELVDPSLSAERLLFRLFHERGVKVFAERELKEFCRCSAARVENLLRGFSQEEREHMIGDDGRIGVTCEFCGVSRSYDPALFD
ncbi:MAG: Hsp33 family molecular chaperone [Methylocystis sp.]